MELSEDQPLLQRQAPHDGRRRDPEMERLRTTDESVDALMEMLIATLTKENGAVRWALQRS
jgi:hypothetical protein